VSHKLGPITQDFYLTQPHIGGTLRAAPPLFMITRWLPALQLLANLLVVALAVLASTLRELPFVRYVPITCVLFALARFAFGVGGQAWKGLFAGTLSLVAVATVDNAFAAAPAELIRRGQNILDSPTAVGFLSAMIGCLFGAAQPAHDLHHWKLRTTAAFSAMILTQRIAVYMRTGDSRMVSVALWR
jgi:hypothetical protein